MAPASRWMGRAALLVAATLLSALLGEVGLRAAGVARPLFYRFDPILGSSLLPGAEGRWSEEGESQVRISSQGLRDREHGFAKPPGVLRIAVLGDSYAQAFYVPRERSFWALLEHGLGRCPGVSPREVEAINFGVSGFGTAQELLAFRHRAIAYEPDLVLLLVTTSNDIRNNSRGLQGSASRPYFVLGGDGVVLDGRYREREKWKRMTGPYGRLIEWLSLHSRIYQLYESARQSLRRREQSEAAAADRVDGLEMGLDSQVYREPPDEVWREAWLVTEGMIRQLDRDVREAGARLLVVTGSSAIQVDPDPQKRSRFAEAMGVPDLLYPDRRVERLARSEGIPFLMTVPVLRAWAEREGACVHGFANTAPCTGHWNEDGNRIVAESVARKLCRDFFRPRADPTRSGLSPSAALRNPDRRALNESDRSSDEPSHGGGGT